MPSPQHGDIIEIVTNFDAHFSEKGDRVIHTEGVRRWYFYTRVPSGSSIYDVDLDLGIFAVVGHVEGGFQDRRGWDHPEVYTRPRHFQETLRTFQPKIRALWNMDFRQTLVQDARDRILAEIVQEEPGLLESQIQYHFLYLAVVPDIWAPWSRHQARRAQVFLLHALERLESAGLVRRTLGRVWPSVPALRSS